VVSSPKIRGLVIDRSGDRRQLFRRGGGKVVMFWVVVNNPIDPSSRGL